MLVDHALERNRRYAWRRYYSASLAAMELAEWIEQSGIDIPPGLDALIVKVRERQSSTNARLVHNYVAAQRLGLA